MEAAPPSRLLKPPVYLCVLEQNGGVEAGVGLGDVEAAVVGHLLLQGAHVRWRRRRRTLSFTRPPSEIRRPVIQLTVDQLFFFADVGKQLLECLLVLDEALKRDDRAERSDVARSRSPERRAAGTTHAIRARALALLEASAVHFERLRPAGSKQEQTAVTLNRVS